LLLLLLSYFSSWEPLGTLGLLLLLLVLVVVVLCTWVL